MKTKQAAVKNWVKVNGVEGTFAVYQFPRGHWACATVSSPVGRSLAASGFIYPELRCKARQWEWVFPTAPATVSQS